MITREKGKTLKLMGMDLSEFSEDYENLTGFVYGKIKMGEQTKAMEKNMIDRIADGYCLLLPRVMKDEEDDFDQRYAVIFSDWDALGTNGKKDLPRVCTELFDLN